jgi:hypothetical protein
MLILFFFSYLITYSESQTTGAEDRTFWIQKLIPLALPVLQNLANNTLKQNMPYESRGTDRKVYSYLEATGRVICGISAWLELGPENSEEGKVRSQFIDLAVRGLSNAVNPEAPDYLAWEVSGQTLVDAAMLAHGLLRAPTQLWGNFDSITKERMITALKNTRITTPPDMNWLLFASMVEAALMEFAGEYDEDRLMLGVERFRDEWYKGDSYYGDGRFFHMDYYNSFVIHPMFTDILIILKKHNHPAGEFLETQLIRHVRFAEIQERFISPEGTFPVIGRSMTYRFGVFHGLGQVALMKMLPSSITPAQVRCGLTAVISRQLESSKNFDENGWLRVGFTGEQIEMSETYINTGSVYLCTFVFVPLGLPATDPFWTDPYEEWTNLKAWTGKKIAGDEALEPFDN